MVRPTQKIKLWSSNTTASSLRSTTCVQIILFVVKQHPHIRQLAFTSLVSGKYPSIIQSANSITTHPIPPCDSAWPCLPPCGNPTSTSTLAYQPQECPHSSYPLSNGTPFDIEDFGVKLSAGITCPKHDWSFDLHTGRSDRGSYKLTVWETQLRKDGMGGEEVWIRRKQRIGWWGDMKESNVWSRRVIIT